MPTRFHRGVGGLVYHVCNRGSRRGLLFEKAGDYRAFLGLMVEAHVIVPIRILCFILMPNHWHLVLWPENDGQLSDHLQWLERTHAIRWHLARGTLGTGAVYQGRFRAIPIQNDGHLLTVCRYVERNALRAGMVARAEDWPWSSSSPDTEPDTRPPLSQWPVERPLHWVDWVNGPESQRDIDRLRDAIRRQVPFGDRSWSLATAERAGLLGGLRGRGRPRRDIV